ncbi:MAG: hypothetical protein ACTSPI_00250 [Candidatus Heimdallarchaeaceae archaeon]
MFEKTTRLKLRFETVRGNVTAEDLWDMPLLSRDNFNLDTVARVLHKEVKESDEISFVKSSSNSKAALLELRFDIVKHVIATKLKESEAREAFVVKKEKKDFLLRLIKDKKEDAFKDKSVDDLEKELENL